LRSANTSASCAISIWGRTASLVGVSGAAWSESMRTVRRTSSGSRSILELHDWGNCCFLLPEDDAIVALPRSGEREKMLPLIDKLAAEVSRISKMIDALRTAAAAG
jgi:hypothetical protein